MTYHPSPPAMEDRLFVKLVEAKSRYYATAENAKCHEIWCEIQTIVMQLRGMQTNCGDDKRRSTRIENMLEQY